MSSESITKFINAVSFFDAFNEVEKQKFLADQNSFVQYKENDLVFKQGEQGDTLFLVLQGRIGLFRVGIVKAPKERVSLKEDIEKHITNLNPGTVFGEISMLTESKRNVTARVESTQVVVMKITKKLIDSLNHPTQIKFHRQLLLALATHLDNMNSKFIDLQYKYDQDMKTTA